MKYICIYIYLIIYTCLSLIVSCRCICFNVNRIWEVLEFYVANMFF